jgi:hypothetical protein
MIFVDGKWWELYWHPDASYRGRNRAELYNKAREANLNPLPGVFRDPEGMHTANEMQWSLTGTRWTKTFEQHHV